MISPSRKSPLVLVAADDDTIRTRLKAALEADSLTIIEVTESESCRLTCLHLRPDVVLLSQCLTNSFEICRTLKTTAELRHIRVIMILCDATDETYASLEQAQADEHVTLPLRMAVVLQRVRGLLHSQELEAGAEFQREIMAQLADAVVAVDGNSNVIYWNEEAERSYGLRHEDILGQPLDKAYTIDWGSAKNRLEVLRSIEEQGWWRGEGVHNLYTGEQRSVEVAVRRLVTKNNPAFGYVSVIHNVTARKQVERALNEQRELADALRDTAAALTRSLDPQSVMRLILENLERVVPNKTANIVLIDGDRARVGFSRGYTPAEKSVVEQLVVPLYDAPIYQTMLTTGEAYLITDTADDLNWVSSPDLGWVKSYIGMPIRAYDHIVGFLNIDSDVANAFTPTHVGRLQAFADQAAIAVENAQLYEAIYRDAVEMRALHRATAFLYAGNLFTSENLIDICEQVVRVVVDEFSKLDCGILLVTGDDNTVARVARAGEFQVSAERSLYVDGPGLVPEAIRMDKTIYSPNVGQDGRYVASNQTTLSELVVPMRTAKGVLGVLDLQSEQVDAFDEQDIRLLELFAERAAAAIENVKLYSEVRVYTEELEQRVQERTAELNRVKERVEAILNHSSDAILLVRTSGAIQQTNRAFNQMFGSQPDESFDKSLLMFADEAHQAALGVAMTRLMENHQSERLEIVAQRLNGLVFDADVMLSPIISPPGHVSSIVCSLRDITPRKHLELELREALQKERELSELKSDFIARASHEFRTPLAVIHTSSDLLKNYSARMTPEQRDEKFDRLQREVQSIALMLDDLLTISKGEEIKEFDPVLTDLQSLTREMVQEMSEGIGLLHKFAFSSRGDCSDILIDQKLIQRILTNLLANAVKYSPTGSTIRVNVRCDATESVLEVEDEGTGIPDEDMGQLFEAFHRAKNVEHISGTGLGLAIVKQAVELHSGRVVVSSELGKGTVFTTIFPHSAVKE